MLKRTKDSDTPSCKGNFNDITIFEKIVQFNVQDKTRQRSYFSLTGGLKSREARSSKAESSRKAVFILLSSRYLMLFIISYHDFLVPKTGHIFRVEDKIPPFVS